ncbi:MAG: response regulator [Verrucomicrobiota bacterium]
MKILVADDDGVIRAILRTTLNAWKYEIYEASNGLEAQEILEQDPEIRIVILDWVMPVMDGLELCRNLQGKKNTPYILMFTGNGSDEEVRKTLLEAGSNDFLTKPFSPEMLWWKLQAAARYLKDKNFSEAIDHMKILLVDDDKLYRTTLSAVLTKWKHVVREASDGIEALGILDQDSSIQIVILDWLMPGLDGLNVCRTLRKKEKIPYILMASGRKMDLDFQAGLEAGANDYLSKPFSLELLQSRLIAAARFMGSTFSQPPRKTDEPVTAHQSATRITADNPPPSAGN